MIYNKLKSVLGLLLILLFPKDILAAAKKQNVVCPKWLSDRSANIPTCPNGGLVPETFPAGAVVVSDRGLLGQDSGFTADVVQKVLLASGNDNPLLILPVSNETFKKVQDKIKTLPISSELKKKYTQSLLQVPTQGYTWQQDYMQPFVNPKNGQIILREVQGYSRHGNSFNDIIEATKGCGFQKGPDLKNKNFHNGYMGGNIETLPGDICILGDDSINNPSTNWDEYADQVCKSGAENRIKVPTSWLNVGHTDEIMKVVRNNNSPAPCNFSVVFASPNKALELLKENPNENFLNFSKGRGGTPAELINRRSNAHRGIQTLCTKALEIKERPYEKNPKNRERARGVSKNLNNKFSLISTADAGVVVEFSKEDELKKNNCSHLTNKEAYEALMENEDLKIYNQLIQKEMDKLKAEVGLKLKNKFPQCQSDFIDMPDLFYGGFPVEIKKDVHELPEGMGKSILPNPTNAISINNTIISPDPSNEAFEKYMRDQYEKRGLKAEFVDTFDYAHRADGNLHCSTNTIHICKPRGQ